LQPTCAAGSTNLNTCNSMHNFYFYTETAFHHQGDMDYLRSLILASRDAGAAGVKFQVLTKPADFISSRHSAYKDLASWTFTVEQWDTIFEFTRTAGLDIIMMPLNKASLSLLDKHPVRYLEIHSVSFNDHELHEAIRESGVDLIVGVGGRTLDEMDALRQFFTTQLKVLMVGFQSFPSKLEDIGLGRIAWLKARYPDASIGYADHSSWDNEFAVIANDYAFLLGASIFEKHITLQEGTERVDSASAVAPDKIKSSIERLQFLSRHVMLPDTFYHEMNEAETKYRNRQLVCVASRLMQRGTTLTAQDVGLKMSDQAGEVYNQKEALIGKTLKQDIDPDMAFTHQHF